jgi:Ras-related protein Rab-2A
METSAKTAHNVEQCFLQTSTMIYENIDKGVYDLSNDKSGIRVGNESYQIQTKLTDPKVKNESKSAAGCC